MTPEHLVAFAEGLSRIAAAGGGPKAFAGALAQELGATVLVEDADAKHLAAAGGTTAVPAAIRDVVDTSGVGAHTLVRMRNGTPGAALPIFVGEQHFGWVAVFGERVAEREHYVRLAASAIGVELAREAGGLRGRRRTFWERLMAGGYHDAASARDDAATRGITLANDYVAVALELEISDEAHGAGEHAELRRMASEAFRGGEADIALVEGGGSLTFLVPAPREVDVANIRTAATLLPGTLAKTMPNAKVAGGVGERSTLLCVETTVRQAANAMIIGRRMFGIGRVALYADLGIYPLLFEDGGAQDWRKFSERTLAPLRAYDEKHQTELERTLALYFSVGENVKTAAAELNVHRHTVFYRLRQIADICGCKLENPHDQLTLRLAIAIDALIK
jgi:sugar diacid utilization regulator